MNIYRITKYHPAWAQYQLNFDAAFVSQGIKSTPEQRKAVQKKTVQEYMSDFGLSEETLAKTIKERTANKTVHRLYGTD